MNDTQQLPEPWGFTATALWLFALTAVPFALFWSVGFAWMQGQPFLTVLVPWGMLAGLSFGIFFGAFMAFSLRGEKAVVDFDEKDAFVVLLDAAAWTVGYNPTKTPAGEYLTYKPSLQAGLAAGRIYVRLHDGQAVIVGPKTYVRKLLQKLEPQP